MGTALAGAVGAADEAVPPADPKLVRDLLTEIGMVPVGASSDDQWLALRRFQARAGLAVDGVAGPTTVRLLARRAREVRQIRELGLSRA
jgi:murein L,D-transpeptidase YcbB/YkuD